MSDPIRRAGRFLALTLVVYGLLVATHLGEFWPFSIYPMFSQGGNDWSRAVVREVPMRGYTVSWDTTQLGALPGEPLALRSVGVDNIDLANFVSKTEAWTPQRVEALRRLFGSATDDHRYVVFRVNGQITERDSVAVEFVPYVELRPDGVSVNPVLPRTTSTGPATSAR
jgi:hypothetical protein